MKFSLQDRSAAGLIWAVSLTLMLILFRELFLAPQPQVLTSGVDGLKNYFGFLYYLRYDGGATFTGINYPYGDNFLFTDLFPGLSWILALIHQHIFPLESFALPVLHGLILVSWAWGNYLLFKILRHYHLPVGFALAAALLIGGLAPQLHRLEGHFSLALCHFIPWLWWALIQIKGGKKIWLSYWVLFLYVMGGFHAYYVLIGAIMALAYEGLKLLADFREWKKVQQRLLHIFVMVGLPLLLFRLTVMCLDTVPDRPYNIYGLYAYKAFWEGIFLPMEGPWFKLLTSVIDIRIVNLESYAYVGFWGMVFLIFSIGRLWHRKRAKQIRFIWSKAWPRDLRLMLGMSVLVLVYALAIPYHLGLDRLLDVIPALKQFRSLGRFAWVFYYVFTVWMAVYLYVLFRRTKIYASSRTAYLLVGLVVLVSLGEVVNHLGKRRHQMLTSKPLALTKPQLPYTQILGELGLSATDFQAILPLPFFHIGSEKFSPARIPYEIHSESYAAVYQTGIPLATGLTARASFSQSLKLVQQVSHPLIAREVFADLPNALPYLVLLKEQFPLTWTEQLVLRQADLLISREGYGLYRLEAQRLTAYHEEVKAQLVARCTEVDAFGPLLHFNGFDRGASAFGEEVLADDKGPLLLYEGIPELQGAQDSLLTFSVWVKADLRRDAFPVVHYSQFDGEGKQIDYQKLDPKYSTEVYRDWVRVEHHLTLKVDQAKLKVELKGKYAMAESFLLAPSNTEVGHCKPLLGELMYNNFYFSLED